MKKIFKIGIFSLALMAMLFNISEESIIDDGSNLTLNFISNAFAQSSDTDPLYNYRYSKYKPTEVNCDFRVAPYGYSINGVYIPTYNYVPGIKLNCPKGITICKPKKCEKK